DVGKDTLEGFLRYAAGALADQLEAGTAQYRGGQLHGGAGHLTDLDEPGVLVLGLEVLVGQRTQSLLGRPAPQIVDDHVERCPLVRLAYRAAELGQRGL